jgi:hypothetical protein
MRYVTSLYTDINDRESVFKTLSTYCAKKMKDGEQVVSPILMRHAMEGRLELPESSKFWLDWSYKLMDSCTAVDYIIFMADNKDIDKYHDSYRLHKELDYARKLGIEVNSLHINRYSHESDLYK